jgi:hypothetical protein
MTTQARGHRQAQSAAALRFLKPVAVGFHGVADFPMTNRSQERDASSGSTTPASENPFARSRQESHWRQGAPVIGLGS